MIIVFPDLWGGSQNKSSFILTPTTYLNYIDELHVTTAAFHSRSYSKKTFLAGIHIVVTLKHDFVYMAFCKLSGRRLDFM